MATVRGLPNGGARPVLTARNIVKDFPGVRALDRVSFDVYGGEIHALVGENGAGKSTLIKVLAGVHPAGTYEGTVAVGAERCRFRSTRDSEQAGIAVIHQELALVPHLTAGENIFLGDEPTRLGIINWERLYREARNVLERLGLEIDGRETVRNLSVGSQQLVEIAKAIHKRRRVLILDEPTSALSRGEFATLAGLLDDLCKRGTAVIYHIAQTRRSAPTGRPYHRIARWPDHRLTDTKAMDTPGNCARDGRPRAHRDVSAGVP